MSGEATQHAESVRAAKWAERDAKREAFEAEMAAQAERHRQDHIDIVVKALSEKGRLKAGGECVKYARIAIDALLADGVVFARLGPSEHIDGEADGG